ncbi:CBM96 family carbohydrate-binding protein [Dyadobacter sandarakinus]|uniref:DNRLRE domain-containing protein n=1 Tax=Dyadobacter sandarakinus TaxID=2747268 RepID=A0ABX7I4T5_9BACT|nr:malectin domain-containing carbohydrate-binding protein [Dyadobacter sandarakinus]QRR00885.1 DNRLRE domain-containing protein [Dyadobacter sandarakinus]
MKKIFLFLSFTCSAISAHSQTCSVAALKTQADVDNFSINYPGCKVVNRDLDIVLSSITNLNGLQTITRVTGSLHIESNPSLTSLAGLSSLTQIDGTLSIDNNDNLLRFDGLDHLKSPIRTVRIVNNERLTSISGLRGLTRILSLLYVISNPALTSLEGLHNVTRVASNLKIDSNDNLVNLTGLRNLRQVDRDLIIVNNKSLKDFSGLERLESVPETLEITGNSTLTSISELAQLEDPGLIIIKNNSRLSDCSIKIVCSRVGAGLAIISGNAAGCATKDEVRMSANCKPQTFIRINAGGSDFTTATKKLFIADKYYGGIDRTSSIASGDILNTTNDVFYRSGRSSPSFSYDIPVYNGQVNVTLHFAETYFGVPGTRGEKGGLGSRQFHVNMEGSRKLTNYDIFAAAGGAMRANQLTIPVMVTDGVLNVDFLSGAADQPRVSAIEVVAATATLNPVADTYVVGGIYSNENHSESHYLTVSNETGNPTAQRASYLKFQLPAQASFTSAKFRIYGRNHTNDESILLHAYGVDNDSWTETGITKNNAPSPSTPSLGSIAVNSFDKYYEIDVTSYVKAQKQAGDSTVSLLLNTPNNSTAVLSFFGREVSSSQPQLFLETTNSSARTGQEEVLSEVQEKQPSTVFPNPVKDHFTLSLSSEHAGVISFEMVNSAGLSRTVSAVENAKPSENAEVNIAGHWFDPGIYLLKIKSDTFTEMVKILVTK